LGTILLGPVIDEGGGFADVRRRPKEKKNEEGNFLADEVRSFHGKQKNLGRKKSNVNSQGKGRENVSLEERKRKKLGGEVKERGLVPGVARWEKKGRPAAEFQQV